MAKKQPSRTKNPNIEKYPRGAEKIERVRLETIVWRVSIIDRDGPWGWNSISGDTLWKDVYSKLINFETMTFQEIKDGSHLVPVSDLIPKAQKRLVEIDQDDTDELYSLRLTGEKRIWGIQDRSIFKILWWDPSHEVCPSNK